MKTYLAIIAALLFPVLASAQTAPMRHIMPKIKVIDGAKNPELIPDDIAYLHYLLAASVPVNPTDADIDRQNQKLNQLGVPDSERLRLVVIFEDFRQRHDSLVAAFNAYATAAQGRGEFVDSTLFKQQLKDLVLSVRATIKGTFVGDAVEVRVSEKKQHIKIYTTEGAN